MLWLSFVDMNLDCFGMRYLNTELTLGASLMLNNQFSLQLLGRLAKGGFLSESTDAFVISSNTWNFYSWTWILNAALASQLWPFCLYKPLRCQIWRHPQFLSKLQSPKFKFSCSGKYNVHMFEEMTSASVLPEKKPPLTLFLLACVTW